MLAPCFQRCHCPLKPRVLLGVVPVPLLLTTTPLQSTLYLGNLDARRDWGHARDFVEGMWMIMQAEKPEDFVLATGEMRSVREFVVAAFDFVGVTIQCVQGWCSVPVCSVAAAAAVLFGGVPWLPDGTEHLLLLFPRKPPVHHARVHVCPVVVDAEPQVGGGGCGGGWRGCSGPNASPGAGGPLVLPPCRGNGVRARAA